ncbi:MAG: polysaccharide deacetylase family protein [Symbiobacteriia bacterium]
MKRTLAIVAAALILLAGCAAKPASPAAVPPPAVPPATTPVDSTAPGTGTTGPGSGTPSVDSDIVWKQARIGYPLTSDDPRAKGKKVVALTFDDGPASDAQSGATAQVLDILKKENIKATFFVTGYGVKGNPDLLQREIAEGHTIGDHTLTHPDLWKLSKQAVANEIIGDATLIQQYTGKPVKFFRPPNGMYNQNIKEVTQENNLQIVTWTTGALDWEMKDPQKITAQVLNTVMPGAVVLLHDTHKWTAAALPGIIQGLRDKGYEFVVLR